MIETLTLKVSLADTATIVIILLVLAVAGGASLYGIFRFFHRSRIIDDTPTSKIRSAHQGFVELEGVGRLMKGTPIIAPVSQQQCLWFSYKIEKNTREHDIGHRSSHSHTNTSWETIDSGVSDNLFLISDDTGICVVDPEGATVTPSFSKTWYGDRNYAVNDVNSAEAMLKLTTMSSGKDYRFSEKRIDVGADLYILGKFKSIGGRREKLDKNAEVRDLLSKWKTKPGMLLARFDENDDGEIDMDEWQKVMQAAEKEVEQSFSERLVQPEVHTISKPVDSRRPFIISVEDQQTIIGRYKWYSRGSIAGFFISGIAFVWILGIRLAN
jgi:hypothetical protein